jgi:hypothetical protein
MVHIGHEKSHSLVRGKIAIRVKWPSMPLWDQALVDGPALNLRSKG